MRLHENYPDTPATVPETKSLLVLEGEKNCWVQVCSQAGPDGLILVKELRGGKVCEINLADYDLTSMGLHAGMYAEDSPLIGEESERARSQLTALGLYIDAPVLDAEHIDNVHVGNTARIKKTMNYVFHKHRTMPEATSVLREVYPSPEELRILKMQTQVWGKAKRRPAAKNF